MHFTTTFFEPLNTGGITDIQNNDVHVYLTGEIPDLMSQISVGIAENLLLGNAVRRHGARAHEICSHVALTGVVSRRPGAVLGGRVGHRHMTTYLRDAFNNQQL